MACKSKLSEIVATDSDLAPKSRLLSMVDGFDGDHPSDQQLDDYSNGRLDDKLLSEVDDHIAQCSTCCDRLHGLPVEDLFLDKLRTADASIQPFQNGRRIGDYRLVRMIGQGGMGIVYEAMQVSLSRRVALKVLHTANVHDVESLHRFRREARAAANLHHTNIVPIFEIGETEDCQYFAMQLIRGRSLAQVYNELRETPQTDPDLSDADLDYELHARSIAQMGAQVASALAHAHARGVVHRDIKPSNLLLDDTGVVWVADFGLAKVDDDELTQTGQLLGTLRYLSPERFRGVADERCDIYALGASLYELLVRERLFKASDRVELMQDVLHRDPPAPCHVNPNLPRDLETIVLKAIAKDSAKRYQTAAEMADDLQRFCDQEEISARRMRISERLLTAFQTRRLSHVLIAALVSGLLFSLGLLLQRVHQAERSNQTLVAAMRVGAGSDGRGPDSSHVPLTLQTTQRLQAAQRLLASRQWEDVEEQMRSGRALASLQPLSVMLDLDGAAELQDNIRLRIASILSQSPRPLTSWQQVGPIRQLRFQPEPARLLFQDGEGLIRSRSLVEPHAETAPVASVGTIDRPKMVGSNSWSKPLAWHQPRPRVSILSHDGSQVAFATANTAGAPGDSVWLIPADVTENRSFPMPRLEIPTTGSVTSIAFSDDDRYLAVGNLQGLIRVWDLAASNSTSHPLSLDAMIESLHWIERVATGQGSPSGENGTSVNTLLERGVDESSPHETARAVCMEANCVAVALRDDLARDELAESSSTMDGRQDQRNLSVLQLNFHSKTPPSAAPPSGLALTDSQPTLIHYDQPIGWLRWDAEAAVLIVGGVEGRLELLRLQPDVHVTSSLAVDFQVTCAELDLSTGRIAIGGVDDRGYGAVQLWDTHSDAALTPIGRSPMAIAEVELVAGAEAVVCHDRDGTSWRFEFSELNESAEEIQAEVQWILGYRAGPEGSPVALTSEQWDSLRQRRERTATGVASRVASGDDSQRVDNWYLQRIDEALRQQRYATARRRIEQLPSSIRQASRVKLIEGLVAMKEGQLDLAADTLRGVVAAADWVDLSDSSINILKHWLVTVESDQHKRNRSKK